MKLKNLPLSYKKLMLGIMLMILMLMPMTQSTMTVTAININKNKSLDTQLRVEEYEKNKFKQILSPSTLLTKKYSEKYGIDWKLVEAIILHETGNRKSVAFRYKNNSCGMMSRSGIIKFANEEIGVEACVKNLKKNYFDLGLNTPILMQSKYAPISNTWAQKINYYYNKL